MASLLCREKDGSAWGFSGGDQDPHVTRELELFVVFNEVAIVMK